MVRGAQVESRAALSGESHVDCTEGSGNGKVRRKAPGGSVTVTRDLRRAMHEIAKRKGDFTLFALFMPADAPLMQAGDPGTWDLVVSAPWLERGRLKPMPPSRAPGHLIRQLLCSTLCSNSTPPKAQIVPRAF